MNSTLHRSLNVFSLLISVNYKASGEKLFMLLSNEFWALDQMNSWIALNTLFRSSTKVKRAPSELLSCSLDPYYSFLFNRNTKPSHILKFSISNRKSFFEGETFFRRTLQHTQHSKLNYNFFVMGSGKVIVLNKKGKVGWLGHASGNFTSNTRKSSCGWNLIN